MKDDDERGDEGCGEGDNESSWKRCDEGSK